MNVIFLDIDGVLNTKVGYEWNTESCLLLDNICDELDLKIVITSTWRINRSKRDLDNIFFSNFIINKVYDYTPVLSVDRGLEIELWLLENEVDDYIILDDNISDIEIYNLRNIVKCDSTKGFTKKEYNLIKKLIPMPIF